MSSGQKRSIEVFFHFYCGISCSIVYHRSGFHRYD